MNSKKILVTGGAGFIGSHLVDRLIQNDYDVAIIDNLSTGKKQNLNPKAKFYNLDIRDSKISEVFKKEKPKIVFHLAAYLNLQESIVHPSECSDINILGSINIVENFIKFNEDVPNSKFIFSSTGGAIYGDASVLPTPESCPTFPLSPYGVSKLSFEKYLDYYHEIFNLPFIVLSYAYVYGPRQKKGVIPIFCENILKNKKVFIHNSGEQTRDFVFVKDVVEANILSMNSVKGVFNIGMEKEISINTIFDEINKLLRLNAQKQYKKLSFPGKTKSCLDSNKARKELKWDPIYDFDKGLKETVNWFKNEN